MNRNQFLQTLGSGALALSIGSTLSSCMGNRSENNNEQDGDLFFKISLAEWSLNRSIFSGKVNHLDFPIKAKNDFGITAVEYVNQFFFDKAKDMSYLAEMKKRCDDHGVTSLLIMCDSEGNLGDTDSSKRKQTVENHKKWVEAAKFLGCHSIRVNAYGEGTREEVGAAATDGLRSLSEFANDFSINVIVENHGSYSSDGAWLANVIANTEMKNCGTLPDFGNFCLRRGAQGCDEWYDRYKGIAEMMPFAKGVSAKSNDFDASGNCVETDYARMLKIVKDAGYSGYIGIEFEGSMPEDDGIRATKTLLERVGKSLA